MCTLTVIKQSQLQTLCDYTLQAHNKVRMLAALLAGNQSGEDESTLLRKRRKLQVPVKVTTPRRGPLQLGKRPDRDAPQSTIPSCTTKRSKTYWDPQTPKPLTRFQVPNLCRPIELVKEQLEGLTCSDFKDGVQELTSVSYFRLLLYVSLKTGTSFCCCWYRLAS